VGKGLRGRKEGRDKRTKGIEGKPRKKAKKIR